MFLLKHAVHASRSLLQGRGLGSTLHHACTRTPCIRGALTVVQASLTSASCRRRITCQKCHVVLAACLVCRSFISSSLYKRPQAALHTRQPGVLDPGDMRAYPRHMRSAISCMHAHLYLDSNSSVLLLMARKSSVSRLSNKPPTSLVAASACVSCTSRANKLCACGEIIGFSGELQARKFTSV